MLIEQIFKLLKAISLYLVFTIFILIISLISFLYKCAIIVTIKKRGRYMLIEQIFKLLKAISLYLVFTIFILIISLDLMGNLIHQPVSDFKHFPFYKEFFPGLFAVLITLFVSFIGFLISNYLFKKIFPDKYIHFTINSILTFTKAIALFFILGLTTIIADYCIIN